MSITKTKALFVYRENFHCTYFETPFYIPNTPFYISNTPFYIPNTPFYISNKTFYIPKKNQNPKYVTKLSLTLSFI